MIHHLSTASAPEAYVVSVPGEDVEAMKWLVLRAGELSEPLTASAREPEGLLRGALCTLSSELGPQVAKAAARLCAELDRALEGLDLRGVTSSAYVGRNGGFIAEFATAEFILFFAVEQEESDSGWGLSTHRSRGGLLAGGHLSDAPNLAAILRMVLPVLQTFRIRSFESLRRRIIAS